eukprot:870483-Prymnesium_polylepis.2
MIKAYDYNCTIARAPSGRRRGYARVRSASGPGRGATGRTAQALGARAALCRVTDSLTLVTTH